MEKLPQYLRNYKRVELAIILPEMPTTEAKSQMANWIIESLEYKCPVFDYIHIVCHRFYMGVDVDTGINVRTPISKQEHYSLSSIARMTAEGIITFESEEWQ